MIVSVVAIYNVILHTTNLATMSKSKCCVSQLVIEMKSKKNISSVVRSQVNNCRTKNIKKI